MTKVFKSAGGFLLLQIVFLVIVFGAIFPVITLMKRAFPNAHSIVHVLPFIPIWYALNRFVRSPLGYHLGIRDRLYDSWYERRRKKKTMKDSNAQRTTVSDGKERRVNEIKDTNASKIAKDLVAYGLTRRASIMAFVFFLLFLLGITISISAMIVQDPDIMHGSMSELFLLAIWILPIGALGVCVVLLGRLVFSPKWKALLIEAQYGETQNTQTKEKSFN